MSRSDSHSDRDPFLTSAPFFPLLCGLEFIPRPVRLSNESQQDYGQFLDLAKAGDWQFDRQRIQLFLQNPAHALIVTDRRRVIQFVNRGFTRMTGYTSREALQRSPAFLQGPGTSLETKLAIRKCLATDEPFGGDILNYRKNGESYWCWVSIEPIRDHKQQLVHYVAFEREVDRPTEIPQLK